MNYDAIMTKNLKKLIEKVRYYKMMRYSRKGLCGWEEAHWSEKINETQGAIKLLQNQSK